jgi:predicted hotdog family 3-hydroxylacyl-ACP dehydratase
VTDPRPRLVDDLLPHTGTARLLTDVLRSGPGFIEATGRVPAAHPLVASGRAPCFLGLELGAQAAAALEALERAAAAGERAPHVAYLVRVREADFSSPSLPVDMPLHVTAVLSGAAPPLAIYRIGVGVGGVESLRAILSTHSGTSAGSRNEPGEMP